MTVSEFAGQRQHRPCDCCGTIGVDTKRNPNNNGLQVVCPHCGSTRPWGSLLYLKQHDGKRASRPPLPHGETLDSIWAKFENRCVLCSAPKSFLANVGIGRQVHHVIPYAEEGHRGPLIPICTHCHEVANARQRVFWFMKRAMLKDNDEHEPDDKAGAATGQVAGTSTA